MPHDNTALPDPTKVICFWAKVNKNGPVQPHMTTPCWEWTAMRDRQGYGRMKVGGKRGAVVLAHRMSVYIRDGRLDHKMDVLHDCDFTGCVNPYHLRVGTHTDNMRAASERGRLAFGLRNSRHTKPESTVMPWMKRTK